MSGGYFDYKNCDLETEIFGYIEEGEHIPNVFEDFEISHLISDVFELIGKFDYYKSGDIDESDYLEAKVSFKNKWLSQKDSSLIRDIIEENISILRKDLYKTFLYQGAENELF